MKCHACSSTTAPFARYCSNCGARLEVLGANDSRPAAEDEFRFRTYVEHSPHGVFIADERGRYLEVNATACQITGYGESELLQMAIPDLLPPESLHQGLESFSQVRELGVSRAELPFVGKGGRRGWWSVEAVKLSESRFLGYVTDISSRKQIEQQLGQLRDELAHMARLGTLGEMASGLAHELNQPLAALHLYATAAMEHNELIDDVGLRECSWTCRCPAWMAGSC